MGKTEIEWCDFSWNGWWGCTKVHAGCAHCYAETWDARWGGNHWGKDRPRRLIKGEWTKPDRWNAQARAVGVPARVFCSSMCDIFEKYDGPVVDLNGAVQVGVSLQSLRARLWPIVERTSWLRWMLLTKRPENVKAMVPEGWLDPGCWPEHVWVGTSPCDQKTANACIPPLLRLPARLFLSVEPMLGAVDLVEAGAIYPNACGCLELGDEARGTCSCRGTFAVSAIEQVIIGGESEQRGACRRFPVDDAEALVKQCVVSAVPVFVKQFGSMPQSVAEIAGAWAEFTVGGRPLKSHKGNDMAEWPEWARRREVPASMLEVL